MCHLRCKFNPALPRFIGSLLMGFLLALAGLPIYRALTRYQPMNVNDTFLAVLALLLIAGVPAGLFYLNRLVREAVNIQQAVKGILLGVFTLPLRYVAVMAGMTVIRGDLHGSLAVLGTVMGMALALDLYGALRLTDWIQRRYPAAGAARPDRD